MQAGISLVLTEEEARAIRALLFSDGVVRTTDGREVDMCDFRLSHPVVYDFADLLYQVFIDPEKSR